MKPACVLRKIIRRHHHQREAQECGQSQLSRSREENGLLKHAAGRPLLSLSYTQEADPAFEHRGLLRLWSRGCGHQVAGPDSYVAGPDLLVMPAPRALKP